MKTISAIIAAMTFLMALFIGAVSNIVWLFKAAETSPEFWLALVGVFVAPIGIIHGWIVLF
jgi:hypothetical protein